MMTSSYYNKRLLLLLLLAIMVMVMVKGSRNMISWDDLMLDEESLSYNNNNGGQVFVVDQAGNGDSTTVQGAVDMIQQNNPQRVKIYIYPGIYRERVHVPKNKPYISFIGKPNGRMVMNNVTDIIGNDDILPVITNSTKASDKGSWEGQELGMSNTATLWVQSDFFFATALIIQNLVEKDGDRRQAVALRVDSDKAVFYQVKVVGEQDTLLDNKGTHYFYQTYIQGSVDFICGQAKSLFHECILYSATEYWGAIAAHHRNSAEEDTGFSFVNCRIKGNGGRILLGRAWGEYSTTVYSFCEMDDIINPIGWSDWHLPSRQQTAVFGEYQCYGKGSNRTGRVEWSKELSSEKAMPFS